MIQYDLFGNEYKSKPKHTDKEKRKWENAFQRWSDEMHLKTNITEPYGVCGYGSMCDYCEDNTYGRPCVRALNEMCRDKRITINYTERNFEEIWSGVIK